MTIDNRVNKKITNLKLTASTICIPGFLTDAVQGRLDCRLPSTPRVLVVLSYSISNTSTL